jgi:hypothetical protein
MFSGKQDFTSRHSPASSAAAGAAGGQFGRRAAAGHCQLERVHSLAHVVDRDGDSIGPHTLAVVGAGAVLDPALEVLEPLQWLSELAQHLGPHHR